MPNRFHPGEIAVQQRAGVFEPCEQQDHSGLSRLKSNRQSKYLAASHSVSGWLKLSPLIYGTQFALITG
jgi:hypothetical protein